MKDKHIDKTSFGTKTEVDSKGELTEEDFKKLKHSEHDLEKDEENYKENLKESYLNIIDILKEYLDLDEKHYNIISLWIIGTYFHDKFPSFPYLFFNAMKSSGKSRTINLISCLSKDGSVQNSLTEAVLFRTKGTLGIDEFEGVSRKGSENLRELLNSAYKKGVKVRRMKQVKTETGSEQVVEEFNVYRPITLANIWGMESVLGDRCITLVLEKSDKKNIINLMEIFREDEIVKKTIELLIRCSLCRCSFSPKVYREWNNYVKHIYTTYTNNINNINNTNNILPSKTFKSINLMELNGRELELSFPLCMIAAEISDEVLKETTLTFKDIFQAKKGDELVENTDISLYDFVSQYTSTDFQYLSSIVSEFKNFTQINDEWLNNKWMGRALKRLNLIKEKRRVGRGVSIILDINKAQEKIKMFK